MESFAIRRRDIALLQLCLGCAAGFATANLSAQTPDARTPTAAETPTTTLNSQSTLVIVPALVKTKAGDVVYTLKAKDFVLTDDGVPQKLELEEDSGAQPLALAVVIEAGAANRAAGWHPYTPGDPPDRFITLPAMVEAMIAGVPHRIAVVGFDSRPELELGFTSDFDAAAEVIHQLSEANAGDHGAAILDSLAFAVDLLRKAPPGYRRAILLLSETNDRGSELSLADAVRAVSETNTAIYSVAFSSGFHQASEYGSKQLPTKAVNPLADDGGGPKGPPPTPLELLAGRVLQGVLFGITLSNPNPNPPTGCMGVDPTVAYPENVAWRAYDCLAQLVPPLALARMGLIAMGDSLRMNAPKTVARLTGGEYFEFNGAKSLERDLATLANHIPNRYVLSFQPQSPHPGLHVIGLRLEEYPQLNVTARGSYWVDTKAPPSLDQCMP